MARKEYTEEEINAFNNRKFYKVYILFKDDLPIYVGCTSNLKTRTAKHRSNKDFNKVIVVCGHYSRSNSMIIESGMIAYMELINKDILNKHKCLNHYTCAYDNKLNKL